MRNIIILFFISIITLACKKETESKEIVIAGIIKNESNYFDFKPDSTIGAYRSADESCFLDFNSSNTNDIKISSSSVGSPAGEQMQCGLTCLDSSFQIAMTIDSIYPNIFNVGDSIEKYKLWNSKRIKDSYFPITFVYNSYHLSEPTISYDYWNNKIGYIGLRKKNSEGLYTYGWLKLEVSEYYRVTLYEYCFDRE